MIQAKCIKQSDKNNSWLKHDLELNKFYDVENIIMGGCYTDIIINGKYYNSVIFSFFENGKEIDIYKDLRFNPFLNKATKKLIHGDCIENMQIMKSDSVDFTLTDIPYDAVSRESNGLRNLDKGKADILTFDLQKFLEEVYRVTKNSTCIFCGKEQFSTVFEFFANKKGTTRLIIWEKSNPSPMNGQLIYLSGCEMAVWFKKRGGKVFNAFCKNTVFKYPNGSGKLHPTEKNHGLLKDLILDNTNENDIVFDPCMGSGAHLLVAKQNNRGYIGIEIDEHYFNVAQNRIGGLIMLTDKFGRGKGLMTGNDKNDKVYTPLPIAKQIIDLFELKGKVLDPFKGGGAFYNQYPKSVEKDWCEIEQEKDFFDYKQKVDWIITNPPYSIFDEVLEHSFEIADNIVYLVPLSKVFSSMKRIRCVLEYGNIQSIYIIGASKCGFPFGFPCCAIYFKKGYKGQTKIEELKV